MGRLMDEITWFLNSLASIATVLGVVVTYLQYRVKQRTPVGPPGPAQFDPSRPAMFGEPPRRPDRPGSVRMASAWVIIDSAVSLLLLLWVFVQFTEHLDDFSLNMDLSSEVEGIIPFVAAALIGVVTLWLAIRRSVDLNAGIASARGRLIGASAIRLFVGVFLVIIAQVLGGSFDGLPDELATALLAYVGFGIVASLLRLGLLLHPDTRNWVGVRVYPVRGAVGQY
jgi:hypothetical protein